MRSVQKANETLLVNWKGYNFVGILIKFYFQTRYFDNVYILSYT